MRSPPPRTSLVWLLRLSAAVFTVLVLSTLTVLAQKLIASANQPVSRQAVGESLLSQNRPLDAIMVFEDPAWQAVANYRASRYQSAASLFQELDTDEAIYNYGVALARLKRWDDAIGAFRVVLDRNDKHADARFNYELLQKISAEEQKNPASYDGVDQGGERQERKDAADKGSAGTDKENPDEEISPDQSPEPPPPDESGDDTNSGTGDSQNDSSGQQREAMQDTPFNAGKKTMANLGGDQREGEPPPDDELSDVEARKTQTHEADMAEQLKLRRLDDNPAIVLKARMQAVATARQSRQSGAAK